jgi:hypothetical protein
MLKANGSGRRRKEAPSFFTCAQRKSPNCLVKCEAPRLRAASFFIRRHQKKKHKGSNCVCVRVCLPLAAMVSIKFIAAIDSHLYTFFTPAAGRPATHKTTALKAGRGGRRVKYLCARSQENGAHRNLHAPRNCTFNGPNFSSAVTGSSEQRY